MFCFPPPASTQTNSPRYVPSLLRVLSPFPGYLASVWRDSRKLLDDPGFLHAREEAIERVQGLLIGLPVTDHHATGEQIEPASWRELKEVVDGSARTLPQLALFSAVWQRSVAHLQSAAA